MLIARQGTEVPASMFSEGTDPVWCTPQQLEDAKQKCVPELPNPP